MIKILKELIEENSVVEKEKFKNLSTEQLVAYKEINMAVYSYMLYHGITIGYKQALRRIESEII